MVKIKFEFNLKGYFLVAFLFLIPCAKAQNRKLADSLIRVYEISSFNDSVKLQILYDISFNHPNPDRRIFYANKLSKLAQEKDNLLFKFRGHYQKGIGLRIKGDFHQAGEIFYQAIGMASQINYKSGIGESYRALADVYSLNGDFNTSTYYYQKAISIFRETADSVFLASALVNAGDNFYDFNQTDSALFYFEESGKIFNALNDDSGVAYNLGNIGLVYAKQGNFPQAEENLKKANAILESLGDLYPVAVYYIYMAEIFNQKKNITRAMHYGHLSLQLSYEYGLNEQIRDANLKLSELYAQNKEYEKAYQHHTEYVAYRDSINSEEVTRKMADLRTEYEILQKQAEIDLLTKQRQINKLIGIGLIFFTFLLAGLAFVLFRNNRIKRAANRLLSSQKQELEVQHNKLEALNHTKDRFFSIISHDLRGPVSAFNGLSGLIKHYISRNEMGQLREVSEYIDKSARQLSGLLDNLLDWAVKQQGAFPFHPEKIHFNNVLQEIEEMFGITAQAKNITLSINVGEEIVLWADRNSLTTILRNLLNNALKFTEPEGLVTISAYTQKNYAYINIIDTGIGISEDRLDKLFQVKDKVSSMGTSGEKGFGIGLSLAYEFTKMNNGTIMVNSEEKAGTIFTVKIPLYGSYKKSNLKNAEQAEENTFIG